MLPQNSNDAAIPASLNSPNDNFNPSTPVTKSSLDDNNNNSNDTDSDSDSDSIISLNIEPQISITQLSPFLSNVYRNGDLTSSICLTEHHLIIGTHHGLIHILSIPTLQTTRSFRAHTTLVMDISSSAYLNQRSNFISTTQSKPPYLASASIDGSVCIFTPVDLKDVHVRKFGQPIQALAISPDYRSDRTFLCGGKRGQLILCSGGRSGTSTTASPTKWSTQSNSWWKSKSLPSTTSPGNTTTTKEYIIHQDEGPITLIKWSPSGKFVVWVNEQGICIMLSNVKGLNVDSELAWKRIGHVPRPTDAVWDEMGNVWKAHAEWMYAKLFHESPTISSSQSTASCSGKGNISTHTNTDNNITQTYSQSPTNTRSDTHRLSNNQSIEHEKLIVAWGNTVWIMDARYNCSNVDINENYKGAGRVTIAQRLLFDDCVLCGSVLYTTNCLLIMAYTNTQNNHTIKTAQKGGKVEIRLIDITTREEIQVDAVDFQHEELMSSVDYSLTWTFIPPCNVKVKSDPENSSVTTSVSYWWEQRLRSQSRSSLSSNEKSGKPPKSYPQPASQINASTYDSFDNNHDDDNNNNHDHQDNHNNILREKDGILIVIKSNFNNYLITRPDWRDRLSWLTQNYKFKEAINLLDSTPPSSLLKSSTSPKPPLCLRNHSGAELLSSDPLTSDSFTLVAYHKQAVANTWLSRFFQCDPGENTSREFPASSSVKRHTCLESPAKILCDYIIDDSLWNFWTLRCLENSEHVNELCGYLLDGRVTIGLSRVPRSVFTGVLVYYAEHDLLKLSVLIREWKGQDFYDIDRIINTLQNRESHLSLHHDHHRFTDAIKSINECLSELCLETERTIDAVHHLIRANQGDKALKLVLNYGLMNHFNNNITSIIELSIPNAQQRLPTMSIPHVEISTRDCLSAWVGHAYRGTMDPDSIIRQLCTPDLSTYEKILYLFFRYLWYGNATIPTYRDDNDHHDSLDPPPLPPNNPSQRSPAPLPHSHTLSKVSWESRSWLDRHADLVVSLFAAHDPPLLTQFLHSSQAYKLSLACHICEQRQYWPDLIFLLSKTGNRPRALRLILHHLHDITQAIRYVWDHADLDLWHLLLHHCSNNPSLLISLLQNIPWGFTAPRWSSQPSNPSTSQSLPSPLFPNPLSVLSLLPPTYPLNPSFRNALSRLFHHCATQITLLQGANNIICSEASSASSRLWAARRRAIHVNPQTATCFACHQLILIKHHPFLAYDCGHCFHTRCLSLPLVPPLPCHNLPTSF